MKWRNSQRLRKLKNIRKKRRAYIQMWRNIWFIKSERWFVLTYEGPKRYARLWSICRWNEIYYFSFRFTQKALRAVYLTWCSLSFFPYLRPSSSIPEAALIFSFFENNFEVSAKLIFSKLNIKIINWKKSYIPYIMIIKTILYLIFLRVVE